MSDISKKMQAHFAGPNGVWIVERGKETEAKLFQLAIQEIEDLEAALDTANQIIDDEFEQKHLELNALIREWQEKDRILKQSILNIRNSAKGLVTQIDKATDGQ